MNIGIKKLLLQREEEKKFVLFFEKLKKYIYFVNYTLNGHKKGSISDFS